MKRLNFDSQGRLSSIDDKPIETAPYQNKNNSQDNWERSKSAGNKRFGNKRSIEEGILDSYIAEEGVEIIDPNSSLKKSEDMDFLKESPVYEASDSENWSLYSSGKKLDPLKFSNGKTQEDVVREVVDAIKAGHKIVFVHGVCGTGKCLDKETLIFCKPNGNSYFGYHKISEIVGKEGEILCLDKKGNIVKSKFKNVRETGNKKLFKMKTNTGREIVASENHPFLTITPQGVSWAPLNNLDSKSYICLPNSIPLESSKNSLDDNQIKILGHLISEGKLGDKAGSPKYYQDKTIAPLIREDYIAALKQTFPGGRIMDNHQTEVTICFDNKDTRFGTTNRLRLFTREFGLGGTKSGNKFVPEVIFNLSEEKIAIFLQALFSGDGCIYTRKVKESDQLIIEYDSISKKLIYDVSILLSRLGIQHTIGHHKFRENLSYAWRISISNQRNVKKYIEKIGFLGEKQALALSILPRCKTHKFINIDKVPRVIREYLKNKGYGYNELDRLLNYEEIERLRENIGFKKIIKNKLTATPCVFKQAKIDFLRSHLSKINENIKDDTLSFICNEQIFWDKVKSIEFLKEDMSYDLEVLEHHNFIANGIFVHNSAIALNIARVLGKASIVVPVKGLQRQYEEDYTDKKYVLRKNGQKMKIAMITGRDNHDSIIKPGSSCADPLLPDTIKLTDKNYEQIKDYYSQNPYMKNKDLPEVKKLKRIAIAPANPYWSPILPDTFEFAQFKDARKLRYKGLGGKEFIFYHRKQGCSYYDQYLSYIYADVIIFNSAKYKIEVLLDRKPETQVDIIDEADEFLDNFSTQEELNLTRLGTALKSVMPETLEAGQLLDEIIKLIGLEEKNKQALGVDDKKIIPIHETNIAKILKLIRKSPEVEAEIELDENNYANRLLEASKNFSDFLDETYLTFRRYEKDLYVNLVSTNLSKRFHEILDKSNALVLMSGTLHSKEVLRDIYGLKDVKIVEAETSFPGTIEIHRTGKEMDCRYSNMSKIENARSKYLKAFHACIEKATRPILIHVNAFEDLPTEPELMEHALLGLMTRETLRDLQFSDKTGKLISEFKSKKTPFLFTTKCSRGVDFPGDICNSIIFTKYPNPNVQDLFWQLLQKEHPHYYWEFYRDKAKREFLQRIYRAVRSKNDHVYILSPDSRVLDAVREIQNSQRLQESKN